MQITDREHFCTNRVCGTRFACSRRSDSGARAKERGKKAGEYLEQATSQSVRNVDFCNVWQTKCTQGRHSISFKELGSHDIN